MLAQSTGQALHQAPLPAIEKTASLLEMSHGSMEWEWFLRVLDRKDTSYRE